MKNSYKSTKNNELATLRQLLATLNLSSKEIDIYLLLFRKGAQACSTIARYTQNNRTSIYHTLHKLTQRGFLHCFKKRNTTFYTLCDLDRVITEINVKKAAIENQKEALYKLSEIKYLY